MTKVSQYLNKRENQFRVTISKGNKKMGDIPSISLPPLKTCRKCKCNKTCYALLHIYNIYKTAAASYEDNLFTLKNDPGMYWKNVEAALMINRVFRFHVSGDIVDMEYLKQMIAAVKRNPQCDVLVFTKKYELVNEWMKDFGELPDNLHLIFSAWEGLKMENPFSLPECHLIYRNGTTTAAENKKSYYCGGNCTECFCSNKGCFNLQKGEQILIREH